ncbi:MAG: aminotransferase class I/II-fold pyridoxal phosphate-dependent enzyme [Deltaproteobacteria bacterium]|nr:aminotransferase class I/II-fold pyridoxal phosphate-dependent enzyme [Deltaproteobacteria bacterium]
MNRVYLSPPHMTGAEIQMIEEAFASNWIAPLGPHVESFEKEICEKLRISNATALSSGTAALHLALIMLGVEKGDEVWCSTLTFAASANAIAYNGATPVFLDSDPNTWNMNPEILREELELAAKRGKSPKAVIVVDIYGQCADYDPILEACDKFEIPVIEDAAEALGATYKGKQAGAFGEMAVLSFNGNKIITTSGGGMLLSKHKKYTERALFLSTQARDEAPHYEHSEIGYNYRMSNILAAIGRGQLQSLDDKVAARRSNHEFYRMALSDYPGIEFMPEASYGKSNRWLTCVTVDPKKAGITRDDIRVHLERENIEARPVWKPMHLQPVFKNCRAIGGSIAEELFARGLCLPSGSELTNLDLNRIADAIRATSRKTR